MAVTAHGYDQLGNMVLNGVLADPLSLKLMLIQDMYSFTATDTTMAAVAGDELYAAGGYATGGAGLDISAVINGRALSSPAVNWTAFDTNNTGVIGHAVLYYSGTFNGVASPVLMCWTFSPAVTVSNAAWAFSWLNSEVYKIAAAV